MFSAEGADEMIRQFRYRVVFLSYFFFAEYLLFGGDIKRFIAPRFVWMTYISVTLLGILLFFAQRGSHGEGGKGGPGPAKENPYREMAKLFFLIYPLLLFIVFRPLSLYDLPTPTIKHAAKQGISANQTFSALNVEKDGYVHTNLLGLYFIADSQPSLLKRYKFKVIGMVSRVSEKKLSLQRIVIICCAADAQPIEINVSAVGMRQFRKGDWLSVAGRVELLDGPTFIPDAFEKVSKPDDYYISMVETLTQLKIQE